MFLVFKFMWMWCEEGEKLVKIKCMYVCGNFIVSMNLGLIRVFKSKVFIGVGGKFLEFFKYFRWLWKRSIDISCNIVVFVFICVICLCYLNIIFEINCI